MGFPGGTSGKEPAGVAGDSGDLGLIPALRGSPGGGHGNPLQYSCLENPMDRGACWATVHRVAKSRTRLKQRSTYKCYGKKTEQLEGSSAVWGWESLCVLKFQVGWSGFTLEKRWQLCKLIITIIINSILANCFLCISYLNFITDVGTEA